MRVSYDVVPRRPFSLARTAARLARFPELVDRFHDGTYQRLLFAKRAPVLMSVTQEGSPSRASLRVTLTGEAARTPEAKRDAGNVLDKVLGASTDVRPFYRSFGKDPLLGPLIRRHSGLRVAGRVSVWETLLQIVLSQQNQPGARARYLVGSCRKLRPLSAIRRGALLRSSDDAPLFKTHRQRASYPPLERVEGANLVGSCQSVRNRRYFGGHARGHDLAGRFSGIPSRDHPPQLVGQLPTCGSGNWHRVVRTRSPGLEHGSPGSASGGLNGKPWRVGNPLLTRHHYVRSARSEVRSLSPLIAARRNAPAASPITEKSNGALIPSATAALASFILGLPSEVPRPF